MFFSGMTKLKLKMFFKSMQNKITKKCQFYFSFILELKKKKDYMTQNISTVRRKKKKEEEKGKEKKKID